MDISELLDLSNYVEADILGIEHFNSFFKPISRTEDANDYLLEPNSENLKMIKETHYLRVWSMFESKDGELLILPGFRKGAMKYIITEEDWDTEENNIVIFN
jgi:hypothetical protein